MQELQAFSRSLNNLYSHVKLEANSMKGDVFIPRVFQVLGSDIFR